MFVDGGISYITMGLDPTPGYILILLFWLGGAALVGAAWLFGIAPKLSIKERIKEAKLYCLGCIAFLIWLLWIPALAFLVYLLSRLWVE